MSEHLSSELKEFDEWLELQAASNSTRETYIGRVKDFLAKVNEPFSQEVVNKYFLEIKRTWSSKTFNGYREAISAYFKFRKIAITLPRSQKIIRKNPDAIDNKCFQKEFINKVAELFRKKEKVTAILYMLQYCGLRPSEIVGLHRKDFDLKNLEVHFISTKTYTEEVAFYTAKIRGILKAYFLIEKEEKNAFNVTRSAINKICDKLKEANPEYRVRPLLFRHSYGTTVRKLGLDIYGVADGLRHKSVATTEHYVRRDKSEFKKAYLAKMK